MPRLKTCRQEAFADLVASGMQPAEAVTAAGYRAENTKARARELLARPDLLARIAEFRDARAGIEASGGKSADETLDGSTTAKDAPESVSPKGDPEKALEALLRSGGGRAVDKDWIVECLVENIERSLGLKPLRDRGGRTVGSYSHQGSVANKALELLGRQLGLFGEKREGKAGGLDDLSDEELNDLDRDLGRRIAALERIQHRAEAGETETSEPE